MGWSIKMKVGRMTASIGAGFADGVEQEEGRVRVSPWNELYVVPALSKKYPHVEGGEYRTATMLPGATALQYGILAAFDPLKALIAFQNSAQPASGGPANKRCYLDYIRMLVTTPPTSATELLAATVVDAKDRTPTTVALVGAPATATCYKAPVFDPNQDNANPVIVGVPYFPIATAAGLPPAIPAAGQNARTIVGNLPIRSQIPVVSDEYFIDFGSADAVPSGALLTAAPAGASRVVCAHPGVILGPLGWFLFHLWGPSNVTAGIAFKGLDMGWWEK